MENIEIQELKNLIKNGQIGVLTFLLQMGLDPNTKDNRGNTLLCYAAEQNNLDMVELLLSYKTDPNQYNHEGPLTDPDSSRGYNTRMDDSFMPDIIQINSPLYIATEHKNTDMVELLLEHEANPSIIGKNGRMLSDTPIVQEAMKRIKQKQEIENHKQTQEQELEGAVSEMDYVLQQQNETSQQQGWYYNV